MRRVLVYLATYNGAQFLREQIDSLLAQKGVDVTIAVADDCSTDGTVDIVQEYIDAGHKMRLFTNPKNQGYRKNFMSLIRMEIPGVFDYYALSDQDDKWLPDKLSAAISQLEKLEIDGAVPALYSSNLTCTDRDLRPIRPMFASKIAKEPPTLRLLRNSATGCTIVFNEALRTQINKFPLDQLYEPHDEIIAQIAIATGVYCFDSESHILYRQHGKNQIGLADNDAERYGRFLSGQSVSRHSDTLRLILELYREDIRDAKMRVFLENIAYYKTRFSRYLRVLFSHKYRRIGFVEGLAFKAALFLKKF